MSNVQALKSLYVALGGTAADVADLDQNADVIAAIADLITNGGITLPAVTSADNGKVLKVVDGEWDLANDNIE